MLWFCKIILAVGNDNVKGIVILLSTKVSDSELRN